MAVSHINGIAFSTISHIRGTAKGSVGSLMGTVLANAAPNVVNSGGFTSGAGAFTHTFPSSFSTSANDIIVVLIETANEAITVSGYTEAGSSPSSNAGTNPTRLTAFWKRSAGGETGVEVGDSGDHQFVTACIVRGCTTSGDPFDATNSSTGGTGTSQTVPGATTTTDNCLVIAALTTSLDNSGGFNWSSWTNASLTGITERLDNKSGGGGIGYVTGVKATAGAYGNTTATGPNSEWAAWSGALKP